MTRSVWILIKYIRELKKRFVSFEIENILFNDYLIDICHTHSSLTITKDNLYELTIRENIFCLFIVEGKRLRGKSPTRWSDQLKESGTLLRRSPNGCRQNTVEGDHTPRDYSPLLIIMILSHEGPSEERDCTRISTLKYRKYSLCVYLKRYVQRIYLSPQRNNNTGKVVFCISNCWVKKNWREKVANEPRHNREARRKRNLISELLNSPVCRDFPDCFDKPSLFTSCRWDVAVEIGCIERNIASFDNGIKMTCAVRPMHCYHYHHCYNPFPSSYRTPM